MLKIAPLLVECKIFYSNFGWTLIFCFLGQLWKYDLKTHKLTNNKGDWKFGNESWIFDIAGKIKNIPTQNDSIPQELVVLDKGTDGNVGLANTPEDLDYHVWIKSKIGPKGYFSS